MNTNKPQAAYRRSNARGFTLVETLIAIAILMVAIAGPLTVANQALTAALGSRNAMIATYLAQDGMETIKNIKDNNVAAIAAGSSITWLDGLDFGCTEASPCTTPDGISFSAGTGSVVGKCTDCSLYVGGLNDAGYTYNSSSGGFKTPFKRSFYLERFNGPHNEAVVTVIVTWTDRSVSNQVKLQELMTDAPR